MAVGADIAGETHWARALEQHGLESAGHYRLTLAACLQGRSTKPVLINPYHIKRSKELDDGHPGKSDASRRSGHITGLKCPAMGHIVNVQPNPGQSRNGVCPVLS